MRNCLMSWVAVSCLAAGSNWVEAQTSSAKKRAAAKKTEEREPVPGYKFRQINGFHLLVSRMVVEEDENSTQRRKPLDVLELELSTLVRDLPPRCVEVLRTIPIWVEWDAPTPNLPDGGQMLAWYHPGNKQNKRYRFDPTQDNSKKNCVEILKLKSMTESHQADVDWCLLLHEIAHAVHHHVFDYENPVIKAAYAQAMSQGLYANRYAATDAKEYFAELSCAYFNHLHYPPKTREELKSYDPTGYRMMELTWGTPSEIEQAQRPEQEKNAMLRLTAARKLLRDKQKQQEAIAALRAVVQEYPNTRAAGDATKLLKRLSPEP